MYDDQPTGTTFTIPAPAQVSAVPTQRSAADGPPLGQPVHHSVAAQVHDEHDLRPDLHADEAAEAEPDDRELLELARAGCPEALSLLWVRYHPYALAQARRFTSGADAEDVAADAFTRIIALIRAGRGPLDHPRTYIARTVRNELTDRSRRRTIPTTVLDDAEQVRAYDDPAREVVAADELARVLTALSSRSERQQRAVRSAAEGIPVGTIAIEMGTTANAVVSLLTRARAGLRRELAGRDPGVGSWAS